MKIVSTFILLIILVTSCDSKMDYELKHDWVLIDSSSQYRPDNIEDSRTYGWRLDNIDTIRNVSRLDMTDIFEKHYNKEKGCAFTSCKVEVKYPESQDVVYIFERKGSFIIIK